jgi:glycosyltransferase involved in cell wall biosynthesis
VFELVKRLEDDFEILVLAPHAPGAKTHEHLAGIEVVRFRYAPVRLQRLAYAGGIAANLKRSPWNYLFVNSFLLSFFFAALRLVRHRQITVVHAHWLVPGGLVAAALKILYPRLRCIATAHGADVFRLRGRAFAAARRWVAEEVDHVTVVGEALAEQARREGWWLPGRCSIAPMGVVIPPTRPTTTQPMPPETILFIGRLVTKKGADLLIEALPHILRRRADCVLLIAGAGPESAALRARAGALGVADRCEFVGPYRHPDLDGLFSRAHVVALPFRAAPDGDREGLGLTVVEALAAGIPVVAGQVPAMDELIAHGRTGYLVPPDDVDSLATALLTVLEDPVAARDTALAGQKSVSERFAWPLAADRYRRLLREAAAT